MSDNANLEQAITDMAKRMRLEADHLDRLAAKLVVENDLGYVSEAIASVTGFAATVRMDILVSRLIRRVPK
jgi:hypothetical protein